MAMFENYCRGKPLDAAETAAPETELPWHFNAGRRTSVSAECWDNSCEYLASSSEARGAASRQSAGMCCAETARGSSKSASTGLPSDVESRLVGALRSTIFFSELSDDLMHKVLSSLHPQCAPANTAVIKQGDEGDNLFVLDKGRVAFEVNGEIVGEGADGSTFGELALLYNSPRAATVWTLEPCSLYTLDRFMFKKIMVAKLSRKRTHSQQVLASIDIFASLPPTLQLRIADALHPVTYSKGDRVIQEGDRGGDFFLIDEGSVDVTANGELLKTQESGSYFGELALIYDLPRAATITVSSERLKVEVLTKAGFEQLIGPDLVAELRKRDPRQHSSTQTSA